MVIWFAVLALIGVALVFDSANLDYRLVMAGALLPTFEGLLGHPWVGHTLVAPVAVMAFIMLVARGKRLVQRRWLGVPIGLFAHLVLDGTWANTQVFWWPFAGWGKLTESQVPEFSRGTTGWALEALALLLAGWAWQRFGLGNPAKRQDLWKNGRLSGLSR